MRDSRRELEVLRSLPDAPAVRFAVSPRPGLSSLCAFPPSSPRHSLPSFFPFIALRVPFRPLILFPSPNRVIKAVTPETAPQLLAGDIPVDPTSTLFQGDGDYAFDAEVHGADSMFVVIPNRRDTPVTVEGLTVKYQAANLVGHLAKESQKILDNGPATGVAIAVLVGVLALMMAAYCAGKRRAKATAEKTAEKVEGKPQGNALV